MTKLDFLELLAERLSGMPEEDVVKTAEYYGEMIDDRIEDGLSEEEAVASLGSINEIVAFAMSDVPAGEKVKFRRRLGTWEIILLILGAPIWLSLLIAAFAVIFSIYAALWSVIISLWSVFAAFIGSALGCVAGGIVFISMGNAPSGIAAIGAGFALAGLSVFAFFGCKSATNGILILTKKVVQLIKNRFAKKEVAK